MKNEISAANVNHIIKKNLLQEHIHKGEINYYQILLKLYSHRKSTDFSKLYQLLMNKFGESENCPALLLFDDIEPAIIQSPDGDSAVLLDRNSDSILRDLKKTIPKQEVHVDQHLVNDLRFFWSTGINYGWWYKTYFEICDYLKIDMPAVFFVKEMPLGMERFTGVVLPDSNIPFVTDVLVKANCFDQLMMLKVCLHELRHVWQHKYYPELFDGYLSQNITDQYYFQPAELDAEAFALWVLETNGISLKLDNYGKARGAELRKRIQIMHESEREHLRLSIIIHPED